MYLGNMVELAESEDLFAHTYHPYTEALLSAIPTTEEDNGGRGASCWRGISPAPVNPPSGCKFHTRAAIAKKSARMRSPSGETWATTTMWPATSRWIQRRVDAYVLSQKVNRLVDIKKAEERFQKTWRKRPWKEGPACHDSGGADRLCASVSAGAGSFRPDLVFLLLPVSVILTHAFLFCRKAPSSFAGGPSCACRDFLLRKRGGAAYAQHLPFPNRAMGNYIYRWPRETESQSRWRAGPRRPSGRCPAG